MIVDVLCVIWAVGMLAVVSGCFLFIILGRDAANFTDQAFTFGFIAALAAIMFCVLLFVLST